MSEPGARVVADQCRWSCQPVAGATSVVARVTVSYVRAGDTGVRDLVRDVTRHVEQRRVVDFRQSWTAHVTCKTTSS